MIKLGKVEDRMKFIKALQKTDTNGKPRKREKKLEVDPRNAVMLSAKAPDFISDETATIGRPSVERTMIDRPVISPSPLETAELIPERAPAVQVSEFRDVTVDVRAVNPCLVAITQPNSSFTEEFRNLRTTVMQKSKKQRLRSIVVASVAPGEGKSVTAINLAWLMAQTEGVTALIIDADLRLPSLSRYVGMDLPVGLSDVLDGDVSLNDAIVRLQPGGLHLLPGGRVRTDVAELLSGPTFAGIVEKAVGLFDYVIIDAPPLGVFADAKILINGADGALLVIRSNYTNYKTLGRIMEDLPAERLLGVVLNESEETSIEGDYYYEYR